MSNLNETYTNVAKDTMRCLIPLMGKVNSKGFNDEAFDMTKVVMEVTGLVGDLLETIDEMDAKQTKMETQLDELTKAINNMNMNTEQKKAKVDINRACVSCKHMECNGGKEPCLSCDIKNNYSNWEPDGR